MQVRVVPALRQVIRRSIFKASAHNLLECIAVLEKKGDIFHTYHIRKYAMAATDAPATPTQPDPETATSINDFVVKTVKGETKTIKDITGDARVSLIVNVASKCGFTPHYTGLQELYSKYHSDGFTVMGFPSNEFGGQEPGTEAEIEEFACSRYKVEFPMMAKVNVKGKETHPVYQYLKKAVPGKISNEVWWNFEKFLIVDGVPTTRYASTTTPASIEKDILKALGKEAK